MRRLSILAIMMVALSGGGAAPARARESLGVFAVWGAFRAEDGARCHAVAEPVRSAPPAPRSGGGAGGGATGRSDGAGRGGAFATIATWPGRSVGGQFHARLSRLPREGSGVYLSIGERRFALMVRGADAWAQDGRMDRSIIAAIRAATTMSVEGTARNGRPFYDLYVLKGAATAIDAAALGCARPGDPQSGASRE